MYVLCFVHVFLFDRRIWLIVVNNLYEEKNCKPDYVRLYTNTHIYTHKFCYSLLCCKVNILLTFVRYDLLFGLSIVLQSAINFTFNNKKSLVSGLLLLSLLLLLPVLSPSFKAFY